MDQDLLRLAPIGLEYPHQRSATLRARLTPVDPAAAIIEVLSRPFQVRLFFPTPIRTSRSVAKFASNSATSTGIFLALEFCSFSEILLQAHVG